MGLRLEKQVNQETDAGNFKDEINSRIQSQIGVRHKVGRDVGEVWNRVNSSTNFIEAITFFNLLPLFVCVCVEVCQPPGQRAGPTFLDFFLQSC